MSDQKITRRRFLGECAAYSLATCAFATGLVTLSGCAGEDEPASGDKPGMARSTIDAAREAADPCHGTSRLSEAALKTRETFKYEKRASDPQKLCKSCNFWQPPAPGELCGECTLVKGPIHPSGSCMSWVEKQKA